METRHSFFLFFHLHYQWIVTFFSRFSILLVQGDHGSAKDATQGTMAKGEWIEKSEEKTLQCTIYFSMHRNSYWFMILLF